MKNLVRTALLACCALFSACLENEEEIEVRPDGSVKVTVRAKGNPDDLADGYPVPLELGWAALSPDTERWLLEVGADTGSAYVQERIGEIEWPVPPGESHPQPSLAVERTFASVEEWPRWLAPETEPYRTAYLERSATLEIRKPGRRQVFVFERVYHGIDLAPLDFTHELEEELPELAERWDDEQGFTPEEWTHIRDVLARRQADAAERFVSDAVLGLYTQGDATLPPGNVAPLLEAVRAAVEDYVSSERLIRVHQLTVGEDGDGEDESALFEEYIAGYRETIRRTIGDALDRAGLERPTIHAVLFALEWGFTCYDHFSDLGDEEFRVLVALPGVLVGGNFDEVEDGKARWKFDGAELQQGDVLLRAVSVLE